MSSFIKWNTRPHAVWMNQMLWLNHLYYFSLYEKERKFGPDPLFCSDSSQQLWLCEKAWMEMGSLHTPPFTACTRRGECDRRSAFQFADNPSTDNVPLQSAGESTCYPLIQRDCERPWLLNETWNDSLEMNLLWLRPSTQWQTLNRMFILHFSAVELTAGHSRVYPGELGRTAL